MLGLERSFKKPGLEADKNRLSKAATKDRSIVIANANNVRPRQRLFQPSRSSRRGCLRSTRSGDLREFDGHGGTVTPGIKSLSERAKTKGGSNVETNAGARRLGIILFHNGIGWKRLGRESKRGLDRHNGTDGRRGDGQPAERDDTTTMEHAEARSAFGRGRDVCRQRCRPRRAGHIHDR